MSLLQQPRNGSGQPQERTANALTRDADGSLCCVTTECAATQALV